MEVLTSLLTILIIVLLGFLSRKLGIFKAEHAKTLSSFVYYFGRTRQNPVLICILFWYANSVFYQIIYPGSI